MRIDIMTLFPDTVNSFLHESIIGRAAAKGILEINCVQIRDFTNNKQNQVDDYPYGGGRGCVLMAQPLKACLDSIIGNRSRDRIRVIYMSPQGKPFDQSTARRLKDNYDNLVLVCGHYEGIDERFIDMCVDEEISLGDFVLTGGEIAAMAVTDAVCRLVPGVLADESCYTGESHWDGLLEYPQYTRPEIWDGVEVPAVLLCGDHAKIDSWRYIKQIERTLVKRPDLFEIALRDGTISAKEAAQAQKNVQRKKLTGNLSFGLAENDFLPCLINIAVESELFLKKRHQYQWSNSLKELIISSVEKQLCYALMDSEEIAGVFVISHDEPFLNEIRDGKWTNGKRCINLTFVAVSEKYYGTGIVINLMKYVDDLCRETGYGGIRTWVNKNNKLMIKLLRESGYKYRGNLEPENSIKDANPYQAYEKIIKNSK